MSTCNRLDLQTLGSQPVMPKILPDHCTVTVRVHFIPLWSVRRKNNDCDCVDIFALLTRNVSNFRQFQCFLCQLTRHLITVVSMRVNRRCSVHGHSAELHSGLLHVLSPVHHPGQRNLLNNQLNIRKLSRGRVVNS